MRALQRHLARLHLINGRGCRLQPGSTIIRSIRLSCTTCDYPPPLRCISVYARVCFSVALAMHPRHADVAPARALAALCGALLLCTDVAEKGSAKAPSRLGRWAVLRLLREASRPCHADGLACFLQRHTPTTRRVALYRGAWFGLYGDVTALVGVASRCLALPAWRGRPHRHAATRRVALTSPRRLAAPPPPEGWLVL